MIAAYDRVIELNRENPKRESNRQPIIFGGRCRSSGRQKYRSHWQKYRKQILRTCKRLRKSKAKIEVPEFGGKPGTRLPDLSVLFVSTWSIVAAVESTNEAFGFRRPCRQGRQV